jgi:hypothetical protein
MEVALVYEWRYKADPLRLVNKDAIERKDIWVYYMSPQDQLLHKALHFLLRGWADIEITQEIPSKL